MRTDGNDSAMPYHVPGVYDDRYTATGLSKREYIAALAMQGILANPEFLANYQDIDIHKASVKNADHLIAELNK